MSRLSAKELWHALAVPEILEAFAVDPAQGLTVAEVSKRRLRYGPNALQEIRPRPAWRVLVDQFASIVIALLGSRQLFPGQQATSSNHWLFSWCSSSMPSWALLRVASRSGTRSVTETKSHNHARAARRL